MRVNGSSTQAQNAMYIYVHLSSCVPVCVHIPVCVYAFIPVRVWQYTRGLLCPPSRLRPQPPTRIVVV